MSNLKKVQIYTDGACSGNPGKGGYGVILNFNGITKEISEGFINTTNNRMEILAAIKGLEALKEKCSVTLYSDSKYLVDSINLGWVKKWKNNNWKKSGKEKAKNIDLFSRLLELLDIHEVEFVWVKGHAGHIENERCDDLATSAILKDNLLVDEGFTLEE
ncbi:MAG: ribonuclease HI [Ruminococcaceae bacterium]|nr:ribonuclease HI [Oscillospiraceae bacterium]